MIKTKALGVYSLCTHNDFAVHYGLLKNALQMQRKGKTKKRDAYTHRAYELWRSMRQKYEGPLSMPPLSLFYVEWKQNNKLPAIMVWCDGSVESMPGY